MSTEACRVRADTHLLYSALRSGGVDVPDHVASETAGAHRLPWDGAMLKPRRGAGSRGIAIVPAGPNRTIPIERDESRNGTFPGIELGLDGVVTTTGVVLGPAARASRLDSARHGNRERLSRGRRSPPRPVSRRGAGDPARGALNVQVRVSEGQPYVIDVNPRLPAGGMALSAAQGLNLPVLVALDLLGDRVRTMSFSTIDRCVIAGPQRRGG
jgi:hypothetical protein